MLCSKMAWLCHLSHTTGRLHPAKALSLQVRSHCLRAEGDVGAGAMLRYCYLLTGRMELGIVCLAEPEGLEGTSVSQSHA